MHTPKQLCSVKVSSIGNELHVHPYLLNTRQIQQKNLSKCKFSQYCIYIYEKSVVLKYIIDNRTTQYIMLIPVDQPKVFDFIQ